MTKTRCQFDKCKKKVINITGCCKYCHKSFCYSHNLMEFHFCDKYNEFIQNKKMEFNTNTLNQKCVAKKITNI